MLMQTRPETRECMKAMVKSMYGVFRSRDVRRNYEMISGRKSGIYFYKPDIGLSGRRYHNSSQFTTFTFQDNKLMIRLHPNEMEKYPEGGYLDFNSYESVLYVSSKYKRSSYQKVAINPKYFNELRELVQRIIELQQLYGCKGFMFRTNYMIFNMFIVLDQQGNPVHISDGMGAVERWFSN